MDQTQFCLVLFLLAVFRDMWNFFYTTEAIVFHNVVPWHRHFLFYFPVDHIVPRSYLKLLPRQNTWEVIRETRKVSSAQNDVLVLSKPRQMSGDQCDKVCTDADTRHIVRVGCFGRGGGVGGCDLINPDLSVSGDVYESRSSNLRLGAAYYPILFKSLILIGSIC